MLADQIGGAHGAGLSGNRGGSLCSSLGGHMVRETLPGMEGAKASRTAVLVCKGRAVAHGRLAVGRFDDPTALRLLRSDERRPVNRARSDAPPKGLAARLDFELFGRQAEAVALRTVAVDDAVRSGANPQLVIIGAGLDGRAWRMPELVDVDVFEVDHPSSQEDKRERAAALHTTAGSLRFVPADLTQADLGNALEAAGHERSRPTTWLLEGVIPYLTPDAAATTVAVLADRSAPGSRLVVTYQTGSPQGGIARLLARAIFVLMGRGDPMANEARRSSWSTESVQVLVTEAGLEVSDDIGLSTLASALAVPARHVQASRVAVADLPAAR